MATDVTAIDKLTMNRAWAFFYPLFLSGLMMSASQPIVHAGLARLPSPELTLAAYAVAFYAAVLLESPILMALPTANALVCDKVAFLRLRRWIMGLSLALSINALIIAFYDPAYDFVFRFLLGSPPDVARVAQPGLQVLSVWPAIVGLRMYYQGILIRFGRTRYVTMGTAARLVTMITAISLGVRFFPQYGIVVGSFTLLLGVTVDGLVAIVATGHLLRSGHLAETSVDPPLASRDVRAFSSFFIPLAVTSTLRILAQPLLLGGIARSHQATLALAAWPVGLGTMRILGGHLRMLQQVVLALAKDAESAQLIRRFCVYVTAGFTAVLLIIAFSPLATFYHHQVIGLEGDILHMANASLRFLTGIPALMAAQSWFQGILIRARRTWPVNLAGLANLVVAVGLIYSLAMATQVRGHLLASLAMGVGLAGEVWVLRRWARPFLRELLSPSRGDQLE